MMNDINAIHVDSIHMVHGLCVSCWIFRDGAKVKHFYAKFYNDKSRAARRVKRFLWLHSEWMRRKVEA